MHFTTTHMAFALAGIGAAVAFEKNDCHALPKGAFDPPADDTAESFMNDVEYSVKAKEALTPSGYTKAFEDLNAVTIQGSYLGVNNIYSYDPELCANFCDAEPLCQAFNIYISRDPSKDPGPNCPNPPSTHNVKCAMYGQEIQVKDAINDGHIEEPKDANGIAFAVKHRASNGYNGRRESGRKSTLKLDTWNEPKALPAAINATQALSIPNIGYIGTQYFTGELNSTQCADLCDGITQVRFDYIRTKCQLRKGEESCFWEPCNYFNTYELISRSGKDTGYYCAFYSREMPEESATVTWSRDGFGNPYKVKNSWGFAREHYIPDIVPGREANENPDPMQNPEPEDEEGICYTTKTKTQTKTQTKTATVTETARVTLMV